MASAGFIRALVIACHFSHFAIDLTYSIKKSIIKTSPIIVMTNNKSRLPVAGPNAAKMNIRNPERNSVGVFLLDPYCYSNDYQGDDRAEREEASYGFRPCGAGVGGIVADNISELNKLKRYAHSLGKTQYHYNSCESPNHAHDLAL